MRRFKGKLAVIGESLVELFFPRLCPACTTVLHDNENLLCLQCTCELPRTNFHHNPDNDVARLFWGRVLVKDAASFFYYQKGSRYQKLIHEMKYNHKKQLGIELGRWYGHELLNTPFCDADIIHPVPLHRRKLKKRGYNQSELIAGGLSEVLAIPMETACIMRTRDTKTQTRKSKYERWSNVEGIFHLTRPEKFKNKHVLLVDDVITTGSTLEACASSILAAEGASVSVLTLAYAKMN